MSWEGESLRGSTKMVAVGMPFRAKQPHRLQTHLRQMTAT